jgi:hypothetical protein
MGHRSSTKQPSSVPNRANTRHPSGVYTSESPTIITTGPTLTPSTFPSKYSTQYPSINSSKPTRAPSIYPSVSPTTSSSLVPTQLPTLFPSVQPSGAPVELTSNIPTTAVSHPPTDGMMRIELSPFHLKLVSIDDLSNVLDKDIAHVAGLFLTDYFRSKLPPESGFQIATIWIETKANGRKLEVEKYLTCSGEAYFNSETLPTTSALDSMVLTAFSDTKSNNEFLTLLMDSSNNFNQVIKVEARGVSNDKVGMSSMLKIILLVIGIVCVSLVVLFIHVQAKRGQKARDLRLTTHFNEAMSSEDYLEPQPLRISNDHKALQRSLVRARFERGIIKDANAKLQADKSSLTPKSNIIKFGPTTEIGDASNIDEERGCLSIMCADSNDTSLSSLWGENATLEGNSSMDTESESGSNIEEGKVNYQIPKTTLYEYGEAYSMTSPIGADIISPQNSESNMMYSPATQNSDCDQNILHDNKREIYNFKHMKNGLGRNMEDSESDESFEQMDSDTHQSSDFDVITSVNEHHLKQGSHDKNTATGNERKPDNSSYFTSVFTRRY